MVGVGGEGDWKCYNDFFFMDVSGGQHAYLLCIHVGPPESVSSGYGEANKLIKISISFFYLVIPLLIKPVRTLII